MTKAVNYKCILKTLIITATIIAGYYKILYGWDQDESYIMLLAYKILKGEIIFKDIWDLHQTSAVLPAILMMRFYETFGITGMALFLRAVTQVILLLTAVFLYFVINRSYGSDAGFFSALIVLNLLPRATLQMEYGLSTVLFSIVSSALILDVWKQGESMAVMKMTIAGLFYGLSVFVYPTMIITLPLYFYVCFFRLDQDVKKRIKYTVFFAGGCIILTIVFLAYILHHMSLSDFFMVLREFGKTADHPKLFPAFQNPTAMIKSGKRIIIYIAGSLGIWFLLRRKLIHLSQVYFVFLIISFASVVIPNITGLRPCGPFGLLERYMVLGILSACMSVKIDDKPLFWTFFAGGIFYYLGSLMGSALGFNENAMFLEMTIIAGAIYGIKAMDSYEEGTTRVFAFAAVCFLILEMAFSKGFLVRVNGTIPANVTMCNDILGEGPFYGIRVSETQKSDYERHINEIQHNSNENYLYLYFGNDPVYNFFFNGEVTSAQYVGTAKPNIQFVDYYSTFGHELPDYIYVDKSMYPDPGQFMNTEFGLYLNDMGYIADIKSMDEFYSVRIIDN